MAHARLARAKEGTVASLLIYVSERQRRMSSHLLFPSPYVHNCPFWDQSQEPGTQMGCLLCEAGTQLPESPWLPPKVYTGRKLESGVHAGFKPRHLIPNTGILTTRPKHHPVGINASSFSFNPSPSTKTARTLVTQLTESPRATPEVNPKG